MRNKGRIQVGKLELNKIQEKTLEKIIRIGKKKIDIALNMSQNKVIHETTRENLGEFAEMELYLFEARQEKCS